VTVTSTPPTGDTGKNPAAYAMFIAGLCGLAATVIMLRKKDED